MRIEHLVSAETGWRAVFAEPDGSESLSRILGWAIRGEDVVGLIVDPAAPSQIVSATEAASPEGGSFARYRYVPPPLPELPAPPPPAPPLEKQDDAAEKLVK